MTDLPLGRYRSVRRTRWGEAAAAPGPAPIGPDRYTWALVSRPQQEDGRAGQIRARRADAEEPTDGCLVESASSGTALGTPDAHLWTNRHQPSRRPCGPTPRA